VTSQDWVAIIGAIAAGFVLVLTAVGALYQRIHQYQERVDGRMTELLDLTRQSSRAEGRLERPRKFPPDWIQ
jgi:hypothetical protein